MKGITSVSLIGGALSDSGFATPGEVRMFKVAQEGVGGNVSIHLTAEEAAQWASVLTKYAEPTK